VSSGTSLNLSESALQLSVDCNTSVQEVVSVAFQHSNLTFQHASWVALKLASTRGRGSVV